MCVFLIQMESELLQFENERADRVRQLHERNKREMEDFDKESMEKGIRWAKQLMNYNIFKCMVVNVQ